MGQKKAVQVLMIIGVFSVAIVAILHLVLLALRLVTAYRLRVWKWYSGLKQRNGLRITYPTGEVSFQFSVRFTKKEAPAHKPATGVSEVGVS